MGVRPLPPQPAALLLSAADGFLGLLPPPPCRLGRPAYPREKNDSICSSPYLQSQPEHGRERRGCILRGYPLHIFGRLKLTLRRWRSQVSENRLKYSSFEDSRSDSRRACSCCQKGGQGGIFRGGKRKPIYEYRFKRIAWLCIVPSSVTNHTTNPLWAGAGGGTAEINSGSHRSGAKLNFPFPESTPRTPLPRSVAAAAGT